MKKILILGILFVAPLFASADALNVCRNSNIVSYAPTAQTYNPDLKNIIFYITDTSRITSLETSINGVDYPVQYRAEGDLVRAKVVIPSELRGDLVTTIGAQSSGGCNTPISFMFTR